MSTQRPAKQAKYDSAIVDVGYGSCIKNFCNPHSLVLKIVDNDSIQKVVNCPNLCMLLIERSNVQKIIQCPVLYSLSIIDNYCMKQIKSSSIQELFLKNVSCLETIEMSKTTKVHLEDLTLIKTLKIPKAAEVVLINVSIENVNALDSLFPNVTSLGLFNIKAVNRIEGLQCNLLKILHLDNCNSLIKLSDLDGFEKIIVKNCISLKSIEDLFGVKQLIIENCPNLKKVRQVKCNELIISRCDKIVALENIISNTLKAEYCLLLNSIDTVYADKLILSKCISLVKLELNEDLNEIIIDNCDNLTYVEFSCEIAFCYNDLSITILGSNQITDISDWYASKLCIQNNNSLESVKSVYNLTELSISNCTELYSLSDITVLGDLSIESCVSLENIVNVYGFYNLLVINCPQLQTFEMFLTELKEVMINGCPNLQLQLNCNRIRTLSLIDCGAIILEDLAEDALVEINNVGLLPNILSKEDAKDCVSKINSRMESLVKNASIILRYIRAFIIRKKYITFSSLYKTNSIYDCAICYDKLTIQSSTLTKCNHLFHQYCISEWLSIKRTCPLCNYHL